MTALPAPRFSAIDAAMTFFDTPEWLPLEFDPDADRVSWLRISEAGYRAASFLDHRMVGPTSAVMHSPWPAAPEEARRDAQYIFHIGNVGSTLISRLLDELPETLAVREPQLLRQLGADADFATVAALLSRTWRPDQRANVKATSFTSEIAARLVQPGSRALFLYVPPTAYLASILAGQNSWQTLEALGQIRLARLRSRCPGLTADLGVMHDGLKAALGWACEMTSLEAAAAALPGGSVLWMDFDTFLADPLRHFTAITDHFGIDVAAPRARAICEGPLMRLYSKALEYEYSAEVRRDTLAEARARHGRAIRDALDWLGGAASRYPAVAQAIRRAQGDA
ncbi:MAG TPA: hypothetical protein VEX35_00730 [Allosphingosinicella sp.]|nr:hypothetical protein [Allosphingosinicella sp.]